MRELECMYGQTPSRADKGGDDGNIKCAGAAESEPGGTSELVVRVTGAVTGRKRRAAGVER